MFTRKNKTIHISHIKRWFFCEMPFPKLIKITWLGFCYYTIIHCLGISKISHKPSDTLICQIKYGQAGISEVYLLFKKSICLVNHLVKVDVYGSTNTNKANIEKLWPIRDVFGVKKNWCCHAINWEKGVANHCQKPISHET